jgi:oligopeptide transport system substrate-binding protein
VTLKTLPTSARDNRVGNPGGTFRMAIGEPVAIDPFNSQESEGQLVTKNVFDTLLTADPSGKVQKLLAADYSRNANCTRWTFELKPGQRFSKGEAVADGGRQADTKDAWIKDEWMRDDGKPGAAHVTGLPGGDRSG